MFYLRPIIVVYTTKKSRNRRLVRYFTLFYLFSLHINLYPSARKYNPWFDITLLCNKRSAMGEALIRLVKQVFWRFVWRAILYVLALSEGRTRIIHFIMCIIKLWHKTPSFWFWHTKYHWAWHPLTFYYCYSGKNTVFYYFFFIINEEVYKSNK